MLEEHFRNQIGLVTRGQARSAGLTDRQITRRVAAGEWVRVARGVFRHASWPVTYEQRALAVCLGLDHAAASHWTAGVVHVIDGIRAGRVHVSVPRGFASRSAAATVHQVRHLFVPDVTAVGPIPVTSIARTVVDLAGVMHPLSLTRLVDHVLVRRRTTIDEIGQAMTRAECAPGRAGYRNLIAALDAWSPGPLPESEPEMELARRIVERGLPAPERQVPVIDPTGRQVARADLGYTPRRVAMEYDSTAWHGTPRASARDVARANAIVAAGWTLLVATADHRRRNFDPFIDDLEAVLSRVMP